MAIYTANHSEAQRSTQPITVRHGDLYSQSEGTTMCTANHSKAQ